MREPGPHLEPSEGTVKRDLTEEHLDAGQEDNGTSEVLEDATRKPDQSARSSQRPKKHLSSRAAKPDFTRTSIGRQHRFYRQG